MEQVFVILAVVIFWIFKGAAGTQRRLPRQGDYDDSDHRGPIDITGETRQRTVEAQNRALEALQRWEEKQRLAGGYGGPPRAEQETVPGVSRTRAGRPATFGDRTTASRRRKQAYEEIARLLEPEKAPARRATGRRLFAVDRSEASPEARSEPASPTPPTERRPSPAAQRRAEERARPAARPAAGAASPPALARLESLPLAARAIVYSEILGRPRSLS